MSTAYWYLYHGRVGAQRHESSVLTFNPNRHSYVQIGCHLANIMIDNQACLYSQHILGASNIIADSLSRDFHIDYNTLVELIHSNF